MRTTTRFLYLRWLGNKVCSHSYSQAYGGHFLMDHKSEQDSRESSAFMARSSYPLWSIAIVPFLLSIAQTSVTTACIQSAPPTDSSSACGSYVLISGILFLLSLVWAAWKVHANWQMPLLQVMRTLEQLSRSDLRQDSFAPHREKARASDAVALIASFRKSMDELLQELHTRSIDIEQLNDRLASQKLNLADGSDSQVLNLRSVVDTIGNVVTSATDSNSAANLADAAANEAASNAVNGSEAVVEAVTAMHEIQESSRRISDITTLVDGIAFQTNILALNAAVEAARAGDQGRGFAVVAGEVRLLATRSAAAAREIKALIVTSSERVAAGSQHFDRAGKSMELVMENLGNVITHLIEIKNGSKSQFEMVRQIDVEISKVEADAIARSALIQQFSEPIEGIGHEVLQLRQCTQRFPIQTQ